MGYTLAWALTSPGDEAIGSDSSIVRGQELCWFHQGTQSTPLEPTAADRGFPICRMGPRPRLEGKSMSLVLVEPHFKRVIKVPASQSHRLMGPSVT